MKREGTLLLCRILVGASSLVLKPLISPKVLEIRNYMQTLYSGTKYLENSLPTQSEYKHIKRDNKKTILKNKTDAELSKINNSCNK